MKIMLLDLPILTEKNILIGLDRTNIHLNQLSYPDNYTIFDRKLLPSGLIHPDDCNSIINFYPEISYDKFSHPLSRHPKYCIEIFKDNILDNTNNVEYYYVVTRSFDVIQTLRVMLKKKQIDIFKLYTFINNGFEEIIVNKDARFNHYPENSWVLTYIDECLTELL